jgi:hypothetical protein
MYMDTVIVIEAEIRISFQDAHVSRSKGMSNRRGCTRGKWIQSYATVGLLGDTVRHRIMPHTHTHTRTHTHISNPPFHTHTHTPTPKHTGQDTANEALPAQTG